MSFANLSIVLLSDATATPRCMPFFWNGLQRGTIYRIPVCQERRAQQTTPFTAAAMALLSHWQRLPKTMTVGISAVSNCRNNDPRISQVSLGPRLGASTSRRTVILWFRLFTPDTSMKKNDKIPQEMTVFGMCFNAC